jgi:Tol biopolymer transport system component
MTINLAFSFTIPPRLIRTLKWALLAAVALLASVTVGPGPDSLVLELSPQSAEGAFPGLNGKIAFNSTRDGNWEIYSMNADGTSQTRLTTNTAFDEFPSFSGDGTKIAFDSTRDGNYEIYSMNADGNSQTRLTNNVAVDQYASWSPDGSKIVFSSDRDGNLEVYVMDADGSDQVRLTNNAALDAGAMFSPDGTKIAFASTRDGGDLEVIVMNADGSGQTNITNNAVQDSLPDWSPDGTKFAFFRSGGVGGFYDIFVMNADGSGATNISNITGDDQSPGWSPDGTKIVFDSLRDGDQEVWSMNADGSSPVQLTSNPAPSDFAADWQSTQPPRINISKSGSYKPPASCYSVRNSSQTQLFTICDNDSGGAPAAHASCSGDGICNDEDTAVGEIQVSVSAADYRIVETVAPVNHTLDPSKETCNASTTECSVQFVNVPTTKPWFPWDVNGDGAVAGTDFFAVLAHFGETKP